MVMNIISFTNGQKWTGGEDQGRDKEVPSYLGSVSVSCMGMGGTACGWWWW